MRVAAAFVVALLTALAPGALAEPAKSPPADSLGGDARATGSPAGDVRAAEPLAAAGDLSDLSLEQLGNVPVTSVSRREESLSHTASSVYVLTS